MIKFLLLTALCLSPAALIRAQPQQSTVSGKDLVNHIPEIRDIGENVWVRVPGGKHAYLKAKLDKKSLSKVIDDIQIQAELRRSTAH